MSIVPNIDTSDERLVYGECKRRIDAWFRVTDALPPRSDERSWAYRTVFQSRRSRYVNLIWSDSQYSVEMSYELYWRVGGASYMRFDQTVAPPPGGIETWLVVSCAWDPECAQRIPSFMGFPSPVVAIRFDWGERHTCVATYEDGSTTVAEVAAIGADGLERIVRPLDITLRMPATGRIAAC